VSAIVVHYPFVLALSKHAVEIHSIFNPMPLQTVPLVATTAFSDGIHAVLSINKQIFGVNIIVVDDDMPAADLLTSPELAQKFLSCCLRYARLPVLTMSDCISDQSRTIWASPYQAGPLCLIGAMRLSALHTM